MYLSKVYGKGGIEAHCVAASIANGIPIYTLETKAPKFIDAEFEKHRMLSSNSSSSRAIPFKALDEIYIPFDLRDRQKGMQGYSSAHSEDVEWFIETIKRLYSKNYSEINTFRELIHKQHLNRYIEPWMFQKKVVTATEWDNFFRLRLAPDAQPEIQELARCMKEAMEQVELTELKLGEWHLPYITEIYDMNGLGGSITLETAIKCSVARCARVSYNNHDNTNPSVEKDLALYESLLSSKHMTPFEHQASPMEYTEGVSITWDSRTNPHIYLPKGATHIDKNENLWSGNFRGFLQYRQLVSQWNG